MLCSSDQTGGRAAGRGGTYNLERGLFFLYSLYVVYSYTDQKFKTDTDKIKKKNQKEPG